MENHIMKGLGFGLTSAIITTLGVLVGLSTSTGSRTAVIGGVLIVAIADALSDSLGIHISEEAENRHSEKGIWISTISTFISKFVVGMSFLVPLIFLSLDMAVKVGIGWGMLLLAGFSYYIGRNEKIAWKAVFEHLLIAIIVITVTYYLGIFVNSVFV